MKWKGEPGFLLIEVMVAMAVLSGGIVMLFRAFTSSLRAAQVSEERFQAALLVEGKVWELERWGVVDAPRGRDPLLDAEASWEIQEDEPQDKETPWSRWEVVLAWDDGERFELDSYRPWVPPLEEQEEGEGGAPGARDG